MLKSGTVPEDPGQLAPMREVDEKLSIKELGPYEVVFFSEVLTKTSSSP